MADINTVIAEASQDLQTIEDFVNLPAGSDVRPRLLPSVNVGTLAGAKQAIFEAGGLPATPFTTKALMTASALVDGDYAMVTDGGADNGLYVKTAGAWVESDYDPLMQAKNYADWIATSVIRDDKTSFLSVSENLFNTNLIPKKSIGLDGAVNDSVSYSITPYIPVESESDYYYNSSSTGIAVTDIIYYNVSKQFLYRRVITTEVNANGVITIPNGCFFVRFNTVDNLFKTAEVMLSKGANAVPYTPYTNPALKNVSLGEDLINDINEGIDFDFLKVSNNLYNHNDVDMGMVVGNDGEYRESSQGAYWTTDFISIDGASDYTVSGEPNQFIFHYISYYDENKVFIVRASYVAIGDEGFQVIRTPTNARYLRLSMTGGGVTDYNRMLNKGNTALPYEVGHERTLNNVRLSDSNIDQISNELNITDDSLVSEEDLFFSSYNLYNPDTVTRGYSLYPVGELRPNDLFQVSDWIPVEGGEVYTASQGHLTRRYIASVVFYDADKNSIEKVPTLELGLGVQQVSMTAPENAAFARISCELPIDDDKTIQRMFYKGDVGLAYARHYKNIKQEYLSEVLNQSVSRKGEILHFTGDKYAPAVLNFADSYSVNDERNISIGNQPVVYEDVTTWWGDLANEFPDYVTKELIGYDASGAYEVHSYHFNPIKINGSDAGDKNRTRPRVMILATHIEQMNHLFPYLAMREICRSWRDSPALAALRFEVEFMVIPYAHPWGLAYQSGTTGGYYRMNSENLSTNADFPFLWTKVEGDAPNGDTPFATQEMRNVKKVAEKFKPHAFFDLHSFSAGEDTNGLWSVVGENEGYKSSLINAVSSLYPELVKVDEDTPPLDKIAWITYGSRARVAAGYGYMLGATGGLIEICVNYKGRPVSEGLYNDGLIFGASLMLSIVTQCIAEYRDNGNPFDEAKYGTYDDILGQYGLTRDNQTDS